MCEPIMRISRAVSNEQNQIPAEATFEAERPYERLSDPKGWMNVSTFTILELSEDEMEHVAGAVLFLKITD
jgi:hypothetical protein